MIAICIRYTLVLYKLADFEKYARNWPEPIRRCGGDLLGYFLPTKLAGPTNIALALINFPDLAAYEKYREALLRDSAAVANVAALDAAQAILIEDRSFLRRVPE
jgi:NIPSNAP protein